jgi:hypothetical protein
MVSQRLEIRILPRKGPVFRIKGNCLPQMVDRFPEPLTHSQRHCHDVVGVVAFRILAQGALQVIEGAVVIAGVEGDRRGVHALRWCFWRGLLALGFAFADAEVESRPLEKLALLRITFENRAEKAGRPREVVPL